MAKNPEIGVYVEVEVQLPNKKPLVVHRSSSNQVRANADNLSLAVVDFENGGRSSPAAKRCSVGNVSDRAVGDRCDLQSRDWGGPSPGSLEKGYIAFWQEKIEQRQ